MSKRQTPKARRDHAAVRSAEVRRSSASSREQDEADAVVTPDTQKQPDQPDTTPSTAGTEGREGRWARAKAWAARTAVKTVKVFVLYWVFTFVVVVLRGQPVPEQLDSFGIEVATLVTALPMLVVLALVPGALRRWYRGFVPFLLVTGGFVVVGGPDVLVLSAGYAVATYLHLTVDKTGPVRLFGPLWARVKALPARLHRRR